MGGTGLSITKGVVSRVEPNFYAHSRMYLMSVQIDAPINPGNSGGPVSQDGKLIGVVMQGYSFSDGLGYMVPLQVIRHVMTDLKDGKHDGFPSLGITVQYLESPTHKQSLGLPTEQTGVIIAEITPGSAAEKHLQVGDVLVKIRDHDIADNATTAFMNGRRIHFSDHISSNQLHSKLPLTIWRDNQLQEIEVPLTTTTHDLLLVPYTSLKQGHAMR